MTEEELERQAKLWHVESALELDQAAKLTAQLTKGMRKARIQRNCKLLGLAVLAVGGIAEIGIVGLGITPFSPQAKFDFLESDIQLGPEISNFNFSITKNGCF